MGKIPLILFAFLFVVRGAVLSQTTPQKFFDALINDKPGITKYVNKDELSKSERLGITYTGVGNKFMLGYELPDEIINGIRSGNYKYELKEKQLDDAFTEVTFSVPDANLSKVYYFNDGFIANSTYIADKWKKIESKYFSFSIEEPKYFNDYCIKRLDDFVDMIADTLGFTISEKRILEKQKIGYIFCADEKGVEKITGFNAKGLAMLGTDEVVTSYQTHFHEVAHILINYKLKSLGLYTLPFFMEGFAVAVGGRGGMAPRVVTDLGYFLQKSGQLTYDSILTFDQFRSIDGSMTYPVSGLYNSFLLNELGGEKYLKLYKNANGNLDYVKEFSMSTIGIPLEIKFVKFLKNYEKDSLMYVNANDTIKPILFLREINGIFAFADDYIKFFVTNKYKVGFDEIKTNKEYFSRKYKEIYELENYSGYNYCIIAEKEYINVYNLFNDELIYSYNSGLSVNPVSIPLIEGFYTFFLSTKLFGDDFQSNGFIIDETFR